MRIEQLHIRNIASIAEADIDFINDLKDEQGAPSSLFLISGETGTGKTVLLDSVTMALYKTTPRIEGVSGKQRNTYTDPATGAAIGISSIEQYTRIGTGPKDECYSELVFTGNDKRHYTIRLTLGVKRTGQYRTPEWLCTCDDGSSWTKDKDVRERVQQAVGLTFEQFCRLSMLAQGQFAEFLCGDRKQREIILEQLTRTERFSRYGEAISLIYKEKKQEREKLEKTIKDQLDMLLSDEQIEEKKNRIGQLTLQLEEARKRQAEADRLNREMEAFDQADLALRQLATQEQQLGQTWNTLTASLLKTDEDNRLLEQAIKAEQQWIDSQQPYTAIYSKKGELSVLTQNLQTGLQTLADKQKERLRRQEQTAPLAEQLRKAQDASATAKAAVNAGQQAITGLTVRRDSLHPAETNSRIDTNNRRKAAYRQLDNDYDQWRTAEQSLAAAQQDLHTLAGREAAQQAVLTDKKGVLDKAQEALDTQQRVYDLMKTSSDKAFQAIRARLREGDTCPLCGNTVDMERLKQDFQSLLDPLENERRQLTAARDEAKKQHDEANNLLRTLQGQILTLDRQIRKAQDDAGKAKAKADKTAAAVGTALDETLKDRIRQNLEALEEELRQQLSVQKQAEELQTAITAQNQSLSRLQKEYEAAEQRCRTAQKAIDDNTNNIQTLTDGIADRQQENVQLRAAIEAALGDLCPQWESDIAGTRQAVLTAAAEYETRVRKQETARHTLDSRREAYSRMLAVQRDTAALQPQWQPPVTPATAVTPDAESRWSQLKTALTTLHTRQQTLADRQRNAQTALADWYGEDGLPRRADLRQIKTDADNLCNTLTAQIGAENGLLRQDTEKRRAVASVKNTLTKREHEENHWKTLNDCFGGTRLRTLVQTYILKPLLRNANQYLAQITNRYQLTCDGQNEQLSILVRDLYNHRIRSSAVLSGGERFQISLALSLALSDLNRESLNVDILFIDEGFGTLDRYALNSVMTTLQNLSSIVGQQSRRVGVISHREELNVIPAKILVRKEGRGKSRVLCPYTGE